MLKKFALIATAALALLLAACQVPGVGNPASAAKAVAGLTLHWNVGRTILPTVPTDLTIDSYDVTLTGADGTLVSKHLVPTAAGADSASFPNLTYQAWTVAVAANSGGQTIATGSTDVDLSFDHSQSVTIILHYVIQGEGTGSIHLSLDLDPASVPAGETLQSVKLVLTDPSGTTTVYDSLGTPRTSAYDLNSPFVLASAPIGNYNAFFQITTQNSSSMAQESVVVARGFDTAGTVKFTDFGAKFVALTGISPMAADTALHFAQPVKLTVGYTPSNASNTFVTWKSSDTNVAAVGPDGLVTAGTTAGSATITATSSEGGFTATWSVTVQADTGVASAMITQGHSALKAHDWNGAKSAFLQAIANDPSNNDAKIWSALIDLTALSVHPQVVDLMRNKIGVLDYPTDMNTLFSETWFNAKFYGYTRGMTQFGSSSNGNQPAVLGDLVETGSSGNSYSLMDPSNGWTNGQGGTTKKFVPSNDGKTGSVYATSWSETTNTNAVAYAADSSHPSGLDYSFYQKSAITAGGSLVRGNVVALTSGQNGGTFGWTNQGSGWIKMSYNNQRFMPDPNGTVYTDGWYFSDNAGTSESYTGYQYLQKNPAVVGYSVDFNNGPATIVTGGNLVRGNFTQGGTGNAYLYQADGTFQSQGGTFTPDPQGAFYAASWSNPDGSLQAGTTYLTNNGLSGYSQIQVTTPTQGGNLVRGTIASGTTGWVNAMDKDGNWVSGQWIFTPDPAGDTYASNWSVTGGNHYDAVSYLKANPSVQGYSQTYDNATNKQTVVAGGTYIRGNVVASTDPKVNGWVSGQNPDGSGYNAMGIFTPDPNGSVYASNWKVSTNWDAKSFAAAKQIPLWYYSYNVLDLANPQPFPNLAPVPGFNAKDDSSNAAGFSGYGIDDWSRLLALNVLNRNPVGVNGLVDTILTGPYGTALDTILARMKDVPDDYRSVVPADLLSQLPGGSNLSAISIGKPELLLLASTLEVQKSFLQYVDSVDLTYPVTGAALFQVTNSLDFVDANGNGVNDPAEAIYNANPGLFKSNILKERTNGAAMRATSKATFLSALTDIQAAMALYQAALGSSATTTFYKDTIANIVNGAKDSNGNPIDGAAQASTALGNVQTALTNLSTAIANNGSLTVPLLSNPNVLTDVSYSWASTDPKYGSLITVNPGALWAENALDLRKWVVTDSNGFQLWLTTGWSNNMPSTTPMLLPTNRSAITAAALGIDTSVTTTNGNSRSLSLAVAMKVNLAQIQKFYPGMASDFAGYITGPSWNVVSTVWSNSGPGQIVYGPYKPSPEGEMFISWVNR